MKLNHIKDKFDDREIQPSDASWEKLSQRLDADQKYNKKPIIIWFAAIAAVVVLGLTVVPSLFVTNSRLPVERQVNIENQPMQENLEGNYSIQQIKDPIQKPESNIAATEEVEEVKVDKNRKTIIQEPVGTKTRKIQNSAIAILEPKNIKPNNEVLNEAMALENQEVLEPRNLKSKLSESDALLNAALNKFSSQSLDTSFNSIAINKTRSIDPQKLLRETEWDLEARNRNRLENTLLDGLGRLKREALALIDREQ
jgi:hypothetical protein